MPYPLRESISLNGIDLTLYRAARIGGSGQGPVEQETNVEQLTGEKIDVSEEPLVLDTFHLGFGYSWRLLSGTYAWAENADARFPRLLLPGPFVNTTALPNTLGHSPRCGSDYNGNFYFGIDNQVWRVPGGNGVPVLDYTLPSGNIAWSMDTFLGNLYVGTSLGHQSSSAPSALAQNASGTWTGSGPNRKGLAHAWYQAQATGSFGTWQLIGSDTTSSVVNCVTGPMTAGNWGAQVTVGDSTYAINSLVSDQGHIYVAKTNGLHDVDGTTGFTPNLMPWFETAIDDDNGVSSVSANGHVYTNHIAGLFRLDVSGGSTTGLITAVTPGLGLPNETPIFGKITAMTSYGQWLIAAVYNGTDTYLMWGRDIRQGDAGTSPFGYGAGYGASPQAIGPSPMLWHGALVKLPGQICRLLAVSALTVPPRLWIGSYSQSQATPYIAWVNLPRTENPLLDPGSTFATSWTVHVTGQDWVHPVTPKNLLQIDVQADGLSSNTALNFNVGLDGGSEMPFGTATTSPQSSVVGDKDAIGNRFSFSIVGTGGQTTPAIVRALMPRAQVMPALRRVRTYEVLLGEGNVDRFGGRDIGRPVAAYWQLEELQWRGRVSLRDEFGQTYQVLVLPPVQRRVTQLGGESGKGTAEPVIVATLTLKLLAADPPQIISTPTVRWDDGTSRWDATSPIIYWGMP